MARQLDAIFFDVDDTLYSSTDFAERARARSIDAMIHAGLRTDVSRVRSLLDEVIGEYSSNFQYQFDEVLQRLPAELYRPVNPAVIVAAAVIAYHDTKFRELRPYDDVQPVLRNLRGRGARLGVVTQGIPTKQAEKLIRMGLIDLFEPDLVFVTEQMEMSKEDPRLWQEIARRSRVEPARAMYVGDHPVRDVDVPNGCGYTTVLIRRGGKYSGLSGSSSARHEIRDFLELDSLLRQQYGI